MSKYTLLQPTTSINGTTVDLTKLSDKQLAKLLKDYPNINVIEKNVKSDSK